MASNIQNAVNSMIGAAGQASTLFQLTPMGQEMAAKGKYNKSMAQLNKLEAQTEEGIETARNSIEDEANHNLRRQIREQKMALEDEFINQWGSPQQLYINQLKKESMEIRHKNIMRNIARKRAANKLQEEKQNKIMQNEKLTNDRELIELKRGIALNEKLTPDWLKEGK